MSRWHGSCRQRKLTPRASWNLIFCSERVVELGSDVAMLILVPAEDSFLTETSASGSSVPEGFMTMLTK